MSNILDKIQSPSDLTELNINELTLLAGEIREFLVKSVSRTGGHLASNLGVVELTLALLSVFDVAEDRIIWDVGHQSYVYKILTGRKDKFDSLRKFGGISGFPKSDESIYDHFNTGHSSTSASAALGMARARDLRGEKCNVIAVFGDGALTGGMMYEAMNDAGHSNSKVIYILNDNAMSISQNVGAIASYLRVLRQKPMYHRSKAVIQDLLDKLPKGGARLAKYIRKIKKIIRAGVLPTTIFEDFGFDYYGPIDGHNFEQLFQALNHAKNNNKSIFIHIHTKKGKGYAPAEDNPSKYHGISPIGSAKNDDFSSIFGKKLLSIASDNEKVVAITGAMPIGTGLSEFSKIYKNRYFDVGIAEQHAVCMAAGLAKNGMIPLVPLYSSFLQRAYDQILHDVCLQKLHVVFPIDRAGIVGADGETHQGMFDISFLYSMPDMTILAPTTFKELEEMLEYAVNKHNAPIAIRYPRGTEPAGVTSKTFCIGKGYVVKEGDDAVIFTCGRMVKTAIEVADICKENGINIMICSFPTIKPLDAELIRKSIKGKTLAITIEDGVIYGGFGSAVSSLLASERVKPPVMIKAFPDKGIVHGNVNELDSLYGMDAKTIAMQISEVFHE